MDIKVKVRMRWVSYRFDRMEYDPYYRWYDSRDKQVALIQSKFKCVTVVNPRPPFRRCN